MLGSKVSSTTDEAKTVAPAPMTVSKTNRPWMAVASLLALIALTVIFFINQNKQQKSMLALQEKMEQTVKPGKIYISISSAAALKLF